MLPHALEDKNMSCEVSGAALSTLSSLTKQTANFVF